MSVPTIWPPTDLQSPSTAFLTNASLTKLAYASLRSAPLRTTRRTSLTNTVFIHCFSWISSLRGCVRRRWFPSTSPLVSFCTSVFSSDICSFDSFTIQSVRIKTSTFHQYRLLILDGHESHLNREFKDYCLEHKILTLCMPPHSSHVLQPLDVVCFSPLKRKYSQRVRDLARKRVFHINKEGFLPAFKDAFFDVFTTENCRKAFEAAGLVPANAQVVLDRLEVRLRTPPEPLLPETPWQSKTPSNTHEFGSQSKLVRESFARSPVTASSSFSQLVKGAEHMLHQAVLLATRNTELEEQLAVITKRKTRKRKRIQQGVTIEYGEAAAQVAAEASVAAERSKKARGGGDQERAQPALRRCSNCRGIGHNARTCKKDTETSSESDLSTTYVGSLFNSDKLKSCNMSWSCQGKVAGSMVWPARWWNTLS
jgi:hypothetical protein